MSEATPEFEDRTAVQVYKSDHQWLLKKQREISARRNQHIPMFDLMRELIKQVKDEGEGA